MFGAETDDDAVAGVNLHWPAGEAIGEDRVHGIGGAGTVAVHDFGYERVIDLGALGAADGGAFFHEAAHDFADVVAPRDAGRLTRQREDRAATIDAELLPERGREIWRRRGRNRRRGEQCSER